MHVVFQDSFFQLPDDILVKDAIFQDRISQLPDDILVNFLSKLEMKNAAQTSVVSKLWRYLWTWRTDLDFDPAILFPHCHYVPFYRFTNEEGNRYLNWVNQVVNMHCGLHLNKFRVVFSRLSAHHSAHLDKWVKFAFSKQVQELVLELVYNDSFKFSLGFDILKHSPCNSGISALKSLHLSYVGVSKDFLEYIFSRCHLLERLFTCCLDVESLKIKAGKLKYLTLINCENLKELEIDAINLMYFRYENYLYPEFLPRLVFSSVPKLVEACFAGHICTCPYPILDHISYISEQLTKLSFSPRVST